MSHSSLNGAVTKRSGFLNLITRHFIQMSVPAVNEAFLSYLYLYLLS